MEVRGVEDGLLIRHLPVDELDAKPNTVRFAANTLPGKKELVEVAGVEEKRKSSQLLGTTDTCTISEANQTPVRPLSDDESGQMLAKIVATWHKLPDNAKREIVELAGM